MTRILAALSLLLLVAFLATRRRRPNPWDDALSDPAFKRALDEGLADVAAGRVRPWAEVARDLGLDEEIQPPDPRTFGLFLSSRDAPWQIDS